MLVRPTTHRVEGATVTMRYETLAVHQPFIDALKHLPWALGRFRCFATMCMVISGQWASIGQWALGKVLGSSWVICP